MFFMLTLYMGVRICVNKWSSMVLKDNLVLEKN